MSNKQWIIASLGSFFIYWVLFSSNSFDNSLSEVSAASLDSSCDVVVFTTPTCPYCKKARKLLSTENVNWCEKDIKHNSSNNSLYKRLGGRGVPLAYIGSERLSGFSKARYKKAIDKL